AVADHRLTPIRHCRSLRPNPRLRRTRPLAAAASISAHRAAVAAVVAAAALLTAAPPAAAQSAGCDELCREAAALVERFELREAPTPAREWPGWAPPRKIAVAD